MLIPFGVLSAAGAGDDFESDYELIATEILGATTSSVTFSSLATYASTYKHLEVRAVYSMSVNGAAILRLNGDSANNYSRHFLSGIGNNNPPIPGGDANISYCHIGFQTASALGSTVISLLDVFSTSKNKTTRNLFGTTGTDKGIDIGSGAWRNLSSVTSVSLVQREGGNFNVGSRFSLYGIKG